MGKVKKARRAAKRMQPYARMDTEDTAKPTPRPETRGEAEKRHHGEVRKWKHEERLLRQKMSKLSKKKKPAEAEERKTILKSIKTSKATMEQRHEAELARIAASKS